LVSTSQVDRAIVLFCATTASTIAVTVCLFWLGRNFDSIRWVALVWFFAVMIVLPIPTVLLHARLQVPGKPAGLLSVFSGGSSWLVGAAFTLYWQMLTFGI
jgi:hypothetical protein